jgi:hypothetical protein
MLLEELAQPFFAWLGNERAAIEIARGASHRARVRPTDRQQAAFFCDDDRRYPQMSIPIFQTLQCFGVFGAINLPIWHAPFGQQLAGARLIGAKNRTSIKDEMNCHSRLLL